MNAGLLKRFAQRAGFGPILIMDDPTLGADQWKQIEEGIENSHTVFILWGQRAHWREGIQKEIELSRKFRKREILLIERGLQVPEQYGKTNIKYSRYAPEDSAVQISEAVCSLRNQVKP